MKRRHDNYIFSRDDAATTTKVYNSTVLCLYYRQNTLTLRVFFIYFCKDRSRASFVCLVKLFVNCFDVEYLSTILYCIGIFFLCE